jgi:hypothetical protein
MQTFLIGSAAGDATAHGGLRFGVPAPDGEARGHRTMTSASN